MMSSKLNFAILGVVVLISTITSIEYINAKFHNQYVVKTIQVKQGWGYEVYYKNDLLIKQTHIPGIAEKKSFHKKLDAKKIGHIVIEKLRKKESPSISKHDLTNANIQY